MTRKSGDTYRPIVQILKVKNGLPTVLKVSGEAQGSLPRDN